MSPFSESSSFGQVLGLLAGSIVVVTLLFFVHDTLKPPFFTTQSPDNTYTVNLYGQKERPAFFTVQVGAVVLKDGQLFWPYQTLHSGDAMDLSFELGWPNHRWIGNNILHLYREENFSELKHPERFVLVNETERVIRHLRIMSSNDKFLGFDLSPGFEIRLTTSASKGDSSDVWITGQFDDGGVFENRAAFDVRHSSQPLAYSIVVTDISIDIQKMSLSDP